jgi:hypothetical protein
MNIMSENNFTFRQKTTDQINSISNEELDCILKHGWHHIALFSYESYTKQGRGAVFFDRQGHSKNILKDSVHLGYIVYAQGKPDFKTAQMIADYDPSWELICQYRRPDGHIRSTRIRTAPDNQNPWGIYLFERLLDINNDETEE